MTDQRDSSGGGMTGASGREPLDAGDPNPVEVGVEEARRVEAAWSRYNGLYGSWPNASNLDQWKAEIDAARAEVTLAIESSTRMEGGEDERRLSTRDEYREWEARAAAAYFDYWQRYLEANPESIGPDSERAFVLGADWERNRTSAKNSQVAAASTRSMSRLSALEDAARPFLDLPCYCEDYWMRDYNRHGPNCVAAEHAEEIAALRAVLGEK